jgi:hypothetical protein
MVATYVLRLLADGLHETLSIGVLMDTVLIADHDLGFVFWLGKLLAEAGYHALPAKRVSDAAQLAAQFEVNVLVVNPGLNGAADFVRTLSVSEGPVIIQIGGQTQELEGVYAWMQKPEEIDDLAALRWLRLIESAVAASTEGGISDAGNSVARHGGGSFL